MFGNSILLLETLLVDGVLFCTQLAHLLTALFAIFGVVNRKHRLIEPWLIVACFEFLFYYLVVVLAVSFQMFISAGACVVYIILLFLSFYSIFAYYRKLANQEKEEAEEVTGNGKFSRDPENAAEVSQAPPVPIQFSVIPVPPPIADVPLDMSSVDN